MRCCQTLLTRAVANDSENPYGVGVMATERSFSRTLTIILADRLNLHIGGSVRVSPGFAATKRDRPS